MELWTMELGYKGVSGSERDWSIESKEEVQGA